MRRHDAPGSNPKFAAKTAANELARREINLPAEVWARVPWTQSAPIQRPKTIHFAASEALTRLANAKVVHRHEIDWKSVRLQEGMGEEEALFWMTAMLRRDRLTPERLAEDLLRTPPRAFGSVESVLGNGGRAVIPPEGMPLLRALYGTNVLVESLMIAFAEIDRNTSPKTPAQV